MGRHEELHAVGALLGRGGAGLVGVVRDTHAALSDRVDAALPAVARPVHGVQRAVTDAVYTGVEVAHRWAPVVGAHVWSRVGDPDAPPPSTSPSGRVLVPATNAVWGDTVESRHEALAVRMAVRVDGADLALDPTSVAAAFAAATDRLVVFVHGLGETEDSWRHDVRRPYGDRLRDDLGHTPVYVRYNTGRHISDNGRDLASLLDELVAAWPVAVDRVDLVGHSMGGLVARSACHYGWQDRAAWVAATRTLVTLGTPHHGAPLEKSVHVVDRVLSMLPETAPLARVLASRSVGIKDLRHGRVVEEDWSGTDDGHGPLLADTRTPVPLVDHVDHVFVASTVTADVGHPVGRLVGDGMVRLPSASGSGRARRGPLEFRDGARLGGLGHLALLNHDEVYQHLLSWLDDRRKPTGEDHA